MVKYSALNNITLLKDILHDNCCFENNLMYSLMCLILLEITQSSSNIYFCYHFLISYICF